VTLRRKKWLTGDEHLGERVGGSWGRRDPCGELRGPWAAVMGQNELQLQKKLTKALLRKVSREKETVWKRRKEWHS